jgi:hypothetical protein
MAAVVMAAVMMAAVVAVVAVVGVVAVVAVVAKVAMASAWMVLPQHLLVLEGSLKTSAPKKIWTLKRARSQKMSLIPVITTKKILTLQYFRLCQTRSHSFKVVVNISRLLIS